MNQIKAQYLHAQIGMITDYIDAVKDALADDTTSMDELNNLISEIELDVLRIPVMEVSCVNEHALRSFLSTYLAALMSIRIMLARQFNEEIQNAK